MTRRCPDDGTCHHLCEQVEQGCFRVAACGPLSGVYPENSWPEAVVAAEGATEPLTAEGMIGRLTKAADTLQAFMDASVELSQRRDVLRIRGHAWSVEQLDDLDALARRVYDDPLADPIDCRRASRVMRDVERLRVASCGVTLKEG